jgi:hypothetical protein
MVAAIAAVGIANANADKAKTPTSFFIFVSS